MTKRQEIWNKYFILDTSEEMTLEVAVNSAMDEYAKAFAEWMYKNTWNHSNGVWNLIIDGKKNTDFFRNIDELLIKFNDENS